MTRTSRRSLLQAAAGAATLWSWPSPLAARTRPKWSVATFRADVTPPAGHPLMGGGIEPARSVDDPLEAIGLVLLGPQPPIVLLAVDWCEIRGEAHDSWRRQLAAAAGTTPSRVLVAAVHQHDAPLADYAAERFLRQAQAQGHVCDPGFCETAVARTAKSLVSALAGAQPLTHIGVGKAQVERVASNRRYHTSDGALRFDRTSSTRDPLAQAADEGTIDPWLRTLEFWSGDRPVAALHAYAVHPMSHYGRGAVSTDFVGQARRLMEREHAGVAQLYFSGASGNVTAGKYNDGAPENRTALAERLAAAMRTSLRTAKRHPLEDISLRSTNVDLPLRDEPGFTEQDLRRRLTEDARPFGQCLAALGLSRRQRIAERHAIDLPLVDFGPAQFLLLPGEAYVEYQRRAVELAGDSEIIVAGYGESGCGYVPTEVARSEGDTNLGDWCWNGPGSEATLERGLRELFAK